MKNENVPKAAAAQILRLATVADSENFSLTIEAIANFRHAYHEIGAGDRHVVETDSLAQLKANISQLEDLHGRLKFLMAEVSGLIRK